VPQAVNVPLYLEWSFWAVVVAAIAIVLSQLPPIYTLVKRAKLEMELYTRIHLTHKVGNPNVQLHLILSNVGGRSIKVKGMTLKLKRDGSDVAVLPAQTYLQDPNGKTTVLLTSFVLKSKDEWAHFVNFLNYFARADEKRYRSAESILKQEIFNKKGLPEYKDRLVEADDQHITEFMAMFNEKFVWYPGEYEVLISVQTSNKKADIEKKHRFTLFESDTGELSKAKDEYKFGDGIYWESGNHPGVVLQIVEA
jgi:hypothetical protein